MTTEYFVVVTEYVSGAEVQRMGPMSERKAETCLRGVIRQINQDAYLATMEPAPTPEAP